MNPPHYRRCLFCELSYVLSTRFLNMLYFYPHEKINVIKKLPATYFKTLQMSFYTKDLGQNFCINNIEFGKIKTKI